MTYLKISLAQLIEFILVDGDGVEVTGLDDAFSLSVSKNGGAFAAGTGDKAEVGSGWYSYELTAAETDTAGPLAIKVTADGVVQQNLVYQVVGSAWIVPSGTNILTAAEAAVVLRCEEDDPDMLQLLPQIDAHIKNATGRDWAAETPIRQEAKSAARILLVQWYENPAMLGQGMASLSAGLTSCLLKLEAIALSYRTFEGRTGQGSIDLPGAEVWDKVCSVTGLVGMTGDQSSSFEAMISVEGQIQQTSTSDLSGKLFRVQLISPEEL
jgi:hypothetical protein